MYGVSWFSKSNNKITVEKNLKDVFVTASIRQYN